MTEIKLEKRYPHSREEDITDAFMRGYVKGKTDRPQGEWVPFITNYYKCSLCGKEMNVYLMQEYNYCPNCGAKMKGASDAIRR